MEDIIELKGADDGPTSIILTGVHGNETCGIEALKRILPSLKIKRGRVLIGYGNPLAIKQNTRFAEMNLNRAFKDAGLYSDKEKATYEYKRAQFLKTYLDQADALLDVHASFTPESRGFIICEDNSKEIAKYLPFDLIASGFNDLEPGATDGYMENNKKIGLCVECGYLGDATSINKAEVSILNFLTARGHIDGPLEIYQQSNIEFNYIYFTKTDNFQLAKNFADFEKISEGELIGIDGDEEIRAKKSGIIIFARNRNLANEEAFLFGEYQKT